MREGRREEERKEERKGKSHPWAVSASLHALCLLASQSILHNQFPAILPLPLYPLLLDSLPSDDSTSVFLLCPSSWKNLNRDTEFSGKGGR